MAPLLTDNTIADWDQSIATELDLYPESDGKPMAENTEQYRWIVMVKENLEILFASEPDIFIAADLLWYPIEASKPIPEDFTLRSQAPDVMVVFGRPKGQRGSYRQWQEAGIPLQVVFEILSPSNKTKKGLQEMAIKLGFYQTYGVEEYYIYDPDTNILQGWLRQEQNLVTIPSLQGWISPRLGIQFRGGGDSGAGLEIYRPDGKKFLSSVELAELAESERQRAESEHQRAESERQRAELAQQQADQALLQLQQAVVRLRQGGMTIAQVAQVMGLSAQQVQELEKGNVAISFGSGDRL
ncbi:MAG: Uma2 family endonuclease [Coleofasciculaceae cyanobacterium SM2_1_6]|nr:Uma2 family endonuclease [Coleofasciculaceae cyanobacterium SM2_1_6]